MAKKVMQFRYYSDDCLDNQPNRTDEVTGAITKAKLTSGSIFSAYLPITQLGIQAFPGTKFYLNNADYPIIVGSTGIYELDLEGLSEITAISFDATSVASIASNDSAYLIIDMVYNQEEEEVEEGRS